MQLTLQGLRPFSEGRPAHQSLTAQLKKKWTLGLKLKAKPQKDFRNRATRETPPSASFLSPEVNYFPPSSPLSHLPVLVII